MKTPTSIAFEFALGVYSGASTQLRKLEAQRTAAVAKATAKYASDIAELQQKIDGAKDTVTRYANAPGNRENLLPAGQKSLSFHNVEIGWRKSAGSLQVMEDTNWDDVLEMVKKKLPAGIRTVQELDKTALKDFIELSAANAKRAAAIGLKLVKEDSFFIKVK